MDKIYDNGDLEFIEAVIMPLFLSLFSFYYKNEIKIKFKKEFYEFIAPYDEVTFESLSEHFNLDKNYIENKIISMVKKGSLKARLCSDRIILKDLTPELGVLKCPNCGAPLNSMPPCKCEHCGIMVVLKK